MGSTEADGSRLQFRAPLLDRLSNSTKSAGLDAAGLRESVRREVRRILNSRAEPDSFEADRADRTVLSYGIPDLTDLDLGTGAGRKRAGKRLADAISAYEPRLQDVVVEVEEQRSGNEESVVAYIHANLVVASYKEPVSFPIVMSGPGAGDGGES